jgi:hypothetical protein
MVSDRLADLAQNKYNRLLTSLLLVMVFSSLAKREGIIRFAMVVISLSILLLILKRLNPHKLLFYFYCLLTAALLLIWGFEHFRVIDLGTPAYIFANIIFLVILGISTYLIQKDILLSDRVTTDLIKGGVAVYILSGISWATVYNILYSLEPQAFNGVSPDNIGPDLFYFSFTTLTTVGYGDVSPTDTFSRLLANLEGIFGVMYPTIFIALLVSLYQSSASAGGRNK